MLRLPRTVHILAFCSLLAIGMTGGPAWGGQGTTRRLAVLEFSGRNLESEVLQAFSDAVRGGALEGLAGTNIKVMTRESMMVMLREMGKTDCVEGDCEVETARNIGADFVISGHALRMEGVYVVTLKLHETKEGGLLSTTTVEAARQIEVLNQLQERGNQLVAGKILPGVSAARPASPTTARAQLPPAPASPGGGANAADAAGPGKVYVDLVAADSYERWDVFYNDEAICTTPCSRWLDPFRPLMLKTRDKGFFGPRPDKINIDGLGHAGDRTGAVIVKAHGTARGEEAGGAVLTTFAGMAVAAGVALTAVGFASDNHRNLATAGLWTGIPGLLALAGGIVLIVDAQPRATIEPGRPPLARRAFDMKIVLGPGFVAGRF